MYRSATLQPTKAEPARSGHPHKTRPGRKTTECKRPELRLLRRDPGLITPRVFDGGQAAYTEILHRVDLARRKIEIHAFVWRDDETGNMLASALLRAANRGVEIHVLKDRIGATYEYCGGSCQSFFHKQIDWTQRWESHFLHVVYPTYRGSFRQRPNPLATAMLEHPNIRVDHEHKIFDHSKLYIFDDSHVILGGMGIGDDHRKEWVDMMVSVDSPDLARRLQARLAGDEPFDARRHIDFLVHRGNADHRGCPMLAQRLALIDGAKRSVTIAMAYLGDPRFAVALARAARRGVKVTLLTSAMADILGNLNRSTCDRLLHEAGPNADVTIVMLLRMVHAKVVVIDGEIADVGSANFTPLSHGVYTEVNLFIRDTSFARELERVVFAHCEHGEQMRNRVPHCRIFDVIERTIVTYQSRKGV
ncbi:MAG: phosphatidylserine/phosphatidylglycerophosphate/cardiolipin synthase family protein [Deltaproteobacteria bacterium]|nr:phosphatidylserine/phosphatidylglycerophosphate/cardiolipin synthase family protein [Deltaproteobacteria bacterium]